MNGVELNSTKKLRACYRCKLIKDQETVNQLIQSGKKTKHVKIVKENMIFLKTQLLILKALTKPGQSWVSKSQNLKGKVPGIYCIKTHGELPNDMQLEYDNELEDDDDGKSF